MESNYLLTIGIPTFNRSYYLENFFSSLLEVVKFSTNIKVLVSDNNSTDDTENICKNWSKSFLDNGIKFHYIKRDTHVSVVENIISLFNLVDTPYFIFLGDDDTLNKFGFQKALAVLKYSPSAVIQNIFSGNRVSSKSSFVNSKKSFKLFYEYGNAFVSIISTEYLLDLFSNKQFVKEVQNNIWPQTIIGYLTILKLESTKKPYILDDVIGNCYIDGNTKLTNSQYWVQSLNDLIQAALIIKKYSNRNYAITSFISYNNSGLIAHLKSIIYYSTLQGIIPPVRSTINILKHNFGFRGFILRKILQMLTFNESIFWFFAKVSVMIKLKSSLKTAELYLTEKQFDFSNKIKNIDHTRTRYQNWF